MFLTLEFHKNSFIKINVYFPLKISSGNLIWFITRRCRKKTKSEKLEYLENMGFLAKLNCGPHIVEGECGSPPVAIRSSIGPL